MTCDAASLRVPPPAIAEAALHPWSAAVARPLGSRAQPFHMRAGLVLALRDPSGRIGLGEASPLPGMSPDTLAGCAQVLKDVPALLNSADQDEAGWPILPSLHALPAARFAFETAFADLWAQKQRDELGSSLTLAQILGGSADPAPIELNAVVASIDEAQAAVQAGFRTLKWKIGGLDFAADRALLQTLRASLPTDVALRVDANGAYSVTAANEHLAALSDLRLEYVEQPVAAGAWDTQALHSAGVPLAADESLLLPNERARLWATKQAVVWVIKPALHGLRGARDLALQAQTQGIDVVITHLFDGPVALAAARELAHSLQSPPRACGLACHAALAVWPALLTDAVVPSVPHVRTDGPETRAGSTRLHSRGGAGLGRVDRPAFLAALAAGNRAP